MQLYCGAYSWKTWRYRPKSMRVRFPEDSWPRKLRQFSSNCWPAETRWPLFRCIHCIAMSIADAVIRSVYFKFLEAHVREQQYRWWTRGTDPYGEWFTSSWWSRTPKRERNNTVTSARREDCQAKRRLDTHQQQVYAAGFPAYRHLPALSGRVYTHITMK